MINHYMSSCQAYIKHTRQMQDIYETWFVGEY